MAEDWADQVARLQLMAGGDQKWDLSPNDQAAIGRALDKVRTLEIAVASATRVSTTALEALESIGKNASGREPLAAAYARGVLEELGNPG
jgi:hypothetical protein